MSDLQFVINPEEILRLLEENPPVDGAVRKLHFEVGFEATRESIVPTILVSIAQQDEEGRIVLSERRAPGCPYPPGHC